MIRVSTHTTLLVPHHLYSYHITSTRTTSPLLVPHHLLRLISMRYTIIYRQLVA